MKILIADDDAISRRLTQKTLERAGYEVLAVENGVLAAKSLAGPDCPRLALLDWVMPGLDGPSVCRMIRSLYNQPYIFMILLTSKESKEDIIAGFEAGADDYLIKPYNPDELKARLRAGQRILQLQDKLVHDHITTRLLSCRTADYFLKNSVNALGDRGRAMNLSLRSFLWTLIDSKM